MVDHIEHIDSLVDEIPGLQQIAKKVQELESDTEAAELLEHLEKEYHKWEARARLLVPGDRKEEFDYQFKGTGSDWRIARYLDSARLLYEPDPQWSVPALAGRMSKWHADYERSFRLPIVEQRRILFDARARIEIGGEVMGTLEMYARIFSRLPRTAGALAKPPQGESQGYPIENEYQLQRVIHSLLVSLSEDVEDEDPSRKQFGASSRIDFVVRDRKIAVEAKFIHKPGQRKRIGNEIAEDIQRYSGHPDVQGVLFVVYDPRNLLENPSGFQDQANSSSARFPVRLVVAS